MAHIVTCQCCKERYDRDKIKTIKISEHPPRYIHATCEEEFNGTKRQEIKEETDLKNYINLMMPNVNWGLVNKNLTTFKKEYHFSDSGIHKTLIYLFEIKKDNRYKNSTSLSIVPYIYGEAREYFQKIEEAQERNKNISIEEINTISISIKPPKRKVRERKNSFSFLDEEGDN